MKKAKCCLFFSFFIAIFFTYRGGFVSAQTSSLYAGYYYFGYTGQAPWGLYARIYTIDPFVPIYEGHLQWDAVVLSYERWYWLQLGYNKNPPYHNRVFYWEVFDSDESTHTDLAISPAIGFWYRYTIVHAQKADFRIWKFLIRDENVNTIFSQEVSANPYAPVDLQCFAETSISSINIDNTHFNYLSYYNGRSWPLWDRHVARADSPYWLQQISHYEFQAGGGG